MKNRIKYYVTILLLSHLTVTLYGQSGNITNINFPSPESGFMPEDMIYAGGKLFLYCGNGIAVYNSNGVYETTILLENGGQPVGQAYIELNHLIQTRTSYNTMVFNGQDKIFAVAPDYSVWSISVSNYSQTKVISPPPMYSGRFYNGSIKLTYDPLSKWLFYAAQGPIDVEVDALPQFFGIYNTRTVPLYQTIFTIAESDNMPDIYDFLVDFKIAENNGSGYVYMSRKKKIQVFQCSFDPMNGTGIVVLARTDTTESNKNGKLVMIDETVPAGGFKKILCLPMITRAEPLSYLYEIDALDPLNHDIKVTSSSFLQSRNWIDALYESSRDQLLCAVKPNMITDRDFLVFNVSLNNENELQLDYNSSLSLFTNNHYPNDTSNFPVYIFRPDQTGLSYYLSKKNEFGKISFNVLPNPQYSWQCLDDQYNSFFERVAQNELSTLFIMKMKGGGFSSLPIGSALGNFYTGQYLNRGFFNENNSMVYLFNDDHIYPNKVFILNPVDGSYSSSQVGDIKIGDIIPNPFNDNEIIVSKYEDENGSIRVYDEELSSYDEYSTGENTNYCGNMFIDPEGFLYILTGMKAGEPLRIKIFDTRNGYTGPDPVDLLYSFPTSENPGHDVPAELVAKFVYNPSDRFVYIYITNNNVPRIHEEMLNRKTLILKVNKTGNISIINGGYASLTYDFAYTSENMIYLAMDHQLIQVDCRTGNTSLYKDDIYIIDLEYDALTNQLFALERPGGTVQNLYVINLNDESLTTVYLNEYQYVSNINFIEESRTIVAYSPIVEDIVLPDYNVKILYIDVSNNFAISEESLELRALSRRDFFNKLNIDIIHDPIHKKLFIPNGFHSNVSMINEIPNEKLFLKKGWNWISFPRLERDAMLNNPVASKEVLENRIYPWKEYIGKMQYLEYDTNYYSNGKLTYIDKLAPQGLWDPNVGFLYYVYSNRGYQIELKPDQQFIDLFGTIQDPSVPVEIYGDFNNWVGYYLPYTQSPFDAIPEEVLNQLTLMRGQYWSCYHDNPLPEGPAGCWRCAVNQGKVELTYGSMVQLFTQQESITFNWQQVEPDPPSLKKDASMVFEYNEKAAYDPVFIELDPNDLPDDIGAFAGDSCIGATKVSPGDTTTLICAYTQGFVGEEITFQFHYNTKAQRPVLNDYLVLNHSSGIREKRRITAGERQPFFLVSFAGHTSGSSITEQIGLRCIPNPALNQTIIRYFIPIESEIKIQLFNSLGVESYQWEQYRLAGEHQITLNTENLPSGLYFIRLSTNAQIKTDKLLIMH